MSPWVSQFAEFSNDAAPFLLDLALRASLILAVTGLAAAALRRGSAAQRHLIWTAGLASALLLPALMVLPGWHVLPGFSKAPASRTVTLITSGPQWDNAPAKAPAQSEQAQASAPSPAPAAAAAPVVTVAPAEAPASATPPSPAVTAGATEPLPPAPPAAKAAISWQAWVLGIWLAGSAAFLSWVLLGHLSLIILSRRCHPVNSPTWADLVNELAGLLKLRRRVVLMHSPDRTMPMTWGVFRSRLLVPSHASEWPAIRRRVVVLHELSHVLRHDCLTQLVAQVACAAYWFNPLVWLAWRRLQVERERACDDLVIMAGARPSDYAEQLVESAASRGPGYAMAAVAMARPSTLEERVRAILDPTGNRRRLGMRNILVSILVISAGLVPVAALRAQNMVGENGATMTVPAASPANPTVSTSPPVRGDATGGPTTTAPTRGARNGAGFTGSTAGGPRGFSPPTPTPTLGEGPTCSLDATIYDVRIPADQIGRIDLANLSKTADDPTAFEKALAELGTAVPLYRASQAVRLAGDAITISTQTPYVTNSQMTRGGETVNSVAYSQTGAIFSIAGKTNGPNVTLDLSMELSTISEGSTPIAGAVKAPMFRRASMAHKGPVTPKQPFVVVSVDAAATDGNGKAVAYIARVTLGTPQP